MGPYAYRKKKLIWGASILDAFGYRMRRPPSSALLRPRRCLVIRLDHMGDVVLALPVFEALRASFPGVHISCLTTPLGADVLRLAQAADDYFVWNCPWFDPRRTQNVDQRAVSEWIVAQNFDCILELRGDLRLIWMLRRIGAGALVGYGATGGGFLLDVNVPWRPGAHAIEKNLALVEAIGGRAAQRRPLFPETLRAAPFPETLGRRPARIAVHPDAGNAAKRWPKERFAALMRRLYESFEVEFELIGVDGRLGEDVINAAGVPAHNRMGRMRIAESVEILRRCDLLVTNDSGPAHVMAALDRPVWIVWSGTADPKVWSPVGSGVTIIKSGVPCEPCARGQFTRADHPCMKAISVDEVFGSLADALKGNAR